MKTDQNTDALIGSLANNRDSTTFFTSILGMAIGCVIVAAVAGLGAVMTIDAFDVVEQTAKGLIIAGWLGAACYLSSELRSFDERARSMSQIAYSLRLLQASGAQTAASISVGQEASTADALTPSAATSAAASAEAQRNAERRYADFRDAVATLIERTASSADTVAEVLKKHPEVAMPLGAQLTTQMATASETLEKLATFVPESPRLVLALSELKQKLLEPLHQEIGAETLITTSAVRAQALRYAVIDVPHGMSA